MIISSVIRNDIYCFGIRMFGFDFVEQIHRRIRINRVIKPGRWLQGFDVDGAIDVQSLTAAVGFEFFFLSRLDPAVSGDAVVLGGGGVGEINRVVLALGCFDLLILF